MPQAETRIDNLDLEQLVRLRNAIDKRITSERERLQSLLSRVDDALTTSGSEPSFGSPVTRQARGRRRLAARRMGGVRGARRGRRGEGWAIVERTLKGMGGKGTTADMKSAWVGRATPLSVALVSYVKSGKLNKRGSGRGAVYELAGNGAPARRGPRRKRGRTAAAKPVSTGTAE